MSASYSSKESHLEHIARHRISAIIRSDDQVLAAEAMRAAVTGGFRIVEFTMTTPGACELIAEFSKNDSLIVGAGTVMDVTLLNQAIEAGAQFVVSPIFDEQIIRQGNKRGIITIPGAHTPREMHLASQAGADLVKLFPAPANVPEYIRSVLGPLPHLRLFPTAGVHLDNVIDVLSAGAVGAGFVRSLFDPDDLAHRAFDRIQSRARAIVERVAHYAADAC